MNHSVMQGKWLLILTLMLVSLTSCLEHLDDEYLYTFTGETVADYLKNRSETFSDFITVLEKTNMISLLATRGAYTCFAPTNAAFEAFLREQGHHYVDSLKQEELEEIAFSHILMAKYLTTDLAEGAIPTANMNDRYLMVSFLAESDTALAVMINKVSRINVKDTEVVNGVVHTLNKVLQPSNSLLPDLMTENPDISLFNEAMFLTSLSDSMRLYVDYSWERMPYIKQTGAYRKTAVQPEKRKYGYTALVETNAIYASKGIHNLDDLKAYAKALNDRMYPADGGAYDTLWTDHRNPLNRFVSYHLLPRTIYYNMFYCTIGTVDGIGSYDFFETMNKALIRTSNSHDGIRINASDRWKQAGIKVLPNVGDNDQNAINGMYHYIDDMLAYDENVRDVVLNDRIRIDMSSLFPEMMSNNLKSGSVRSSHFVLALGNDYLDDLQISKDTRMFYQSVMDGDVTYLQDCFFFEGTFDVKFRIPRVPEGTYEVRIGAKGVNTYGIVQYYFDRTPCGIPLDMRTYGDKWGWPQGSLHDNTDAWSEELEIEVDKAYRNKGFMRGPAGQCLWPNQSRNRQFRWYRASYRKIVTTTTLDEDTDHYIRMKSVMEDDTKACLIDYIELCPKSIYDAEGGEDIY